MKLSWSSSGFSLEIFSSKGKKRKMLNWIYLLCQQQLLRCHVMGEHAFVGERNVSWRYLIMLWLLQGKRDGCTAIVWMWVRLAWVQVPDLPVPTITLNKGRILTISDLHSLIPKSGRDISSLSGGCDVFNEVGASQVLSAVWDGDDECWLVHSDFDYWCDGRYLKVLPMVFGLTNSW